MAVTLEFGPSALMIMIGLIARCLTDEFAVPDNVPPFLDLDASELNWDGRWSAAQLQPLLLAEAFPSLSDLSASVSNGFTGHGESRRQPAGAAGGTAFVTYHKTGTGFSIKLLPLLTKTCKNHSHRYSVVQDGTVRFFKHRKTFTYGLSRNQFVTDSLWLLSERRCQIVFHPAVSWISRKASRLVHWVRDPVDMIVSAYRFHANNLRHTLEPWLLYTGECHYCDKIAFNAMFELCDFSCSYLNLLSIVNETTGVLIEALNSRQTIEHMLGNLWRWHSQADVLHLSVDLLREDFTGTLVCLFRFLELQSPADALDATFQALARTRSKHMTHSLYDNSALHMSLVEHPFWGHQLNAAQLAVSVVLQMQAHSSGCPVDSRSQQRISRGLSAQSNRGAYFRERSFWQAYFSRMEPHGYGDTLIDEMAPARLAELIALERRD